MRPVKQLVPYARNARTHSDEQVAQIAASIREFGWTNPVLVGGDGVIIAGHGRLMAAQRLGLDEVPVIVLDHLTEAQRRALVVADNKIALNAGWDEELLAAELRELRGVGMDAIGFTDAEVESLLRDLDDEPDFSPGQESDQGRLDQLQPKMVTCPHCHAEWDLRAHGQG
jgi:ParB-like chromosome segregation protein Spo0J